MSLKRAIFSFSVVSAATFSAAQAEQEFERKAKLVFKQYDSRELVSLSCRDRRSSCVLRIKTKMQEVEFAVPFSDHGYVPTLNQIMMFIRDDSEALVTVRTGVECTDVQEEWGDKVSAFRLSCFLILNIGNGVIKEWFGEVIPTLQPKSWSEK